MGLIGNILANAAAGGVEGGGEGAAKEGELAIKAYNLENHERIKQQLESERSARDIALKGEQERPLREAHGRYFNALADSVDRGDRAKNAKPTLPKFVPMKDDQGNIIGMLDEHSGAMGAPIPGQPAQEGSAPWYTFGLGEKQGAKPAIPPNIRWSLNGQDLPDGLTSFYPDMVKRGVGESGTHTASTPTVAPRTGERPPLTSFFPSAQAAPARAPAQANPQPQAQPTAAVQPGTQTPSPTDQTGGAVDAARAKLSAAQAGLQRFGLMQQKRDPQGYAAAKQAADAARQEVEAAMATYQQELGPVGAGAPPLRVK